MSVGAPNGLSDDEFKMCLESLQRAGDTSRRIFYGYIVIFGTLLIWALNAIVYPVEQIRLDQIFHRQSSIVRCLIALENLKHGPEPERQGGPVGLSKSCDKTPKSSMDFEVSWSGTPPRDGEAPLTATGTFVTDVSKGIDLSKSDLDYMNHERQYQLDRSAEISRFSIPIIGTSSDRSWLWLINIFLGPLLYYLIRDSAANLYYMLGYLYENSATHPTKLIRLSHPTRLVLLSMAQIVSSSARMTTPPPKMEGSEGRKSKIKVDVMALILMLPVALSLLVLYDWYSYVANADTACSIKASTVIIQHLCNLNIIGKYSDFYSEPEFLGGFLTIPVLLFEFFVFLQINKLLGNLSKLNDRIRNS
jgi:hypothetical protein